MEIERRNLIARNYDRFTFDLVVWKRPKLQFSVKRWKFFNKQKNHEHTVRVRLGWIAVTVWWKANPYNA